MPYKVLKDGATIVRAIGPELELPGGGTTFDHEAEVYEAGTILQDEDVSPVVVRLLDSGDEHIASLIKRVEEGDIDAEEDAEEDVTGDELENVGGTEEELNEPDVADVTADEAAAGDPDANEDDAAQGDEFDPADVVGTVTEITAYMDDHPEHVDAIKEYEKANEARKGILEYGN